MYIIRKQRDEEKQRRVRLCLEPRWCRGCTIDAEAERRLNTRPYERRVGIQRNRSDRTRTFSTWKLELVSRDRYKRQHVFLRSTILRSVGPPICKRQTGSRTFFFFVNSREIGKFLSRKRGLHVEPVLSDSRLGRRTGRMRNY